MQPILDTSLIVLIACSALGQSVPKPEFDVASVKPHRSVNKGLSPPVFLSGGRFTSAAPLIYVIAGAYNIRNPSNPVRLSGVAGAVKTKWTVFTISKQPLLRERIMMRRPPAIEPSISG